MGGLGDAAGAADVNTIVPVSEVATGLRRPLGPGGFMELSQAELSQASGVNHVSACGFTSGLPVATGRKCLHRPVTSERALRAGPVADVPYICNNGRGGAVDGRQPFLPVGATAVNSGLQRGRGHSRSGAVAASLSCFSCSAVWELAAAWVSGPNKIIRRGPGVGVLRNASALCWTPCERGCERGAVSVGCVQRGFSTSACTWAPVVTGRSGRQPLRIRGLTAGREFQAWLSRESLHWGDGRTGCLVLPPWHGRVVLPPEPLRRLQDLAGRGVGVVSLAQGETEALGGLEHLPQGGPPFLPERMPCCGRTEQESGLGPRPRHLVPEGHLAALPRRLGRVPVAYGVTAAPATLASLPSPIVLTPWFVIRWFVIPARGVPLIIIPHRGVIAAMGLQGLQL